MGNEWDVTRDEAAQIDAEDAAADEERAKPKGTPAPTPKEETADPSDS